MNQEEIGKYIRKLRKENNLSQEGLAKALGVTYQAVSKWERGINLPDMSTLSEMSKIFNVNIDDIINTRDTNKKNNKKYLIIIIILVIILLIGIIILISNSNSTYSINDVKSTNNNFNVTGTFIRSSNKTSLIISNIDYNDVDDNKTYKKLNCDLYEEKGDTKKKVSSCEVGKDSTLIDYLKNINIKMNHVSNKCNMFTNSKMTIQIDAQIDDNKTITYNIPLKIDKNSCE